MSNSSFDVTSCFSHRVGCIHYQCTILTQVEALPNLVLDVL